MALPHHRMPSPRLGLCRSAQCCHLLRCMYFVAPARLIVSGTWPSSATLYLLVSSPLLTTSPEATVFIRMQANGHVDGHAAHNGISAFEQSRGDSPRADGLGRARRSSAHHARDGVSQLPSSRCTDQHAPCQSHQPAWCQAWRLIVPCAPELSRLAGGASSPAVAALRLPALWLPADA